MSVHPPGIRRAFRLALRRPRIDDEVADEIAFHLAMRAAELTARGLTPEAAHAEARRRFGDVHQWSARMSAVDRERAAGERRAEWLAALGQDLRFAARAARRAPLFTLLAVVTLALGIGANAAVFGVVKSVLLDALPYADADRLVRVYGRHLDGSLERSGLSPAAVRDVAERQRSFVALAAFNTWTFDVAYAPEGGGAPRVATGAGVSPAFFRTVGARAALGRLFADGDAAPGAPTVAVLSHAAWQREFAGDPRVVGRAVRVAGERGEIVGVLPAGFVGPMGGDADFWFPLGLAAALRDPKAAREQHWVGVVGRLRDGASAEAAGRELAALAAEMARAHPGTDGGRTLVAVPLRDDMVGDTRTPLLVLMASAGLVLLITCANLAGALLSRTLTRRKELAVRLAIGAGRGRLVRQLLTESTALALVGGAAGLLLAALGLAVLRGLALEALPAYAELALDRGAVLVTGLVALATGIAFGVAPALSVGRADPQGTLRSESRGASEGRRARRLRGLLVAGQIALCVSLLAGAGLLARSLWAMTRAPLGYTPDGLLTARVQLPVRDYPTTSARIAFFQRYEERLRALPGASVVASASGLPEPTIAMNSLTIEGVTLPAGDGGGPTFIPYASVSDDYFRAMGIPVRRGRAFTPADHDGAPPAIVVSETMARRYWPDGDPIGARIRVSAHTAERWGVVVGVVGDVRIDPARPEPGPVAYGSSRQETYSSRTFLLRAAGDPLALVQPARRALAALDPGRPLHDVTTLRARLADGLAGRRLPVVLMAAFGTLALVLASVGVYALFAAMAAAREREFGVRVALGSTRGEIAALVLRQGGRWMALGLAGGAVGVVLVARLVRGLLYGVRPFDPLTLAATAAALLACAAVALLVPVRRATRVDPAAVLR